MSGFKSLFFRGGGGGAPKTLTAINTCLDEMEEFKGRDTAFVSDWLTKKKVFKSESALNINYSYRLYINDVDFLYNESGPAPFSRICVCRGF